MNKEFFEAIALLEKENGIPADYMYEKIKAAIISATKNSYGNRDNVVCDIDPEKQTMEVYVRIAVVDEIEEPLAEMTLEQARNYDENAQVGSFVEISLDPKKFGRIVAQTAKSPASSPAPALQSPHRLFGCPPPDGQWSPQEHRGAAAANNRQPP